MKPETQRIRDAIWTLTTSDGPPSEGEVARYSRFTERTVRKHAAILGVSLPRPESRRTPDWSPAELQIVDANVTCSARVVEKLLRDRGFSRSRGAVERMIYERRDPASVDADQMVAGDDRHVEAVLANGGFHWRCDRTKEWHFAEGRAA